MHEILRNLRAGSLVLDLGCANGSFLDTDTGAIVVRVDRDAPTNLFSSRFVQADAARLPFADHTFQAVISNHSLEHIDDLKNALGEIGRVILPGGSLFVAVPDASTFTDKLYRWLAKGGGHVNPFTSQMETASAIERGTGLAHVGSRVLYSSLSFLNRRHATSPIPRRLLPLGAGHEWSLFLYVWASRRIDRLLKTRTSIYGWAFYFGEISEPIDTTPWANVCIRCGSGVAAQLLTTHPNLLGVKIWQCPSCHASNPFAGDPKLQR